MIPRPRDMLAVAVLLACLTPSPAADDVTARNPLLPPLFSLDRDSPEVLQSLLRASDLLLPTGQGTPQVVIPAENLSLFHPHDELDGLSLDWWLDAGQTFVLVFSVDRATDGALPPDPNLVALGFPFNTQDQALKQQAASDAFISLHLFNRQGPLGHLRSANNTLVINGGDAGGVDFQVYPQGLSPSAPNPSGQQSDVDGGAGTQPPASLRQCADPARGPFNPVLFSLSSDSPSLGTLPGTGSGADVYIDRQTETPGGEELFVAPYMLGLLPADDIDAVVVFENGDGLFDPGIDQVLFSLAPGSPSLETQFSPADLFTSSGFGLFERYATALDLGLAFGDNLNMLDYVVCDSLADCVHDWAIGFVLCVGDLDGDNDVDLADLALLLSSYGLCDGDPGYLPAADLEPDGCVNLADLALLLSNYGAPCP